jgi:predicted dehydrogenase
MNRRKLLRNAGVAGLGLWSGACATTAAPVRRARPLSPDGKLRIAAIGVGGRGASNLEACQGENIVALCDVFASNLEHAARKFPNAKTYGDFRRLFDDEASFDAVIVSSSEHTHAFATMAALKLGKHVYCEKPLTHGVGEAQLVAETAARTNVATQMGTQMHATDNYRRAVELVQAGTVGGVREVHVWVSRAWGWQSPEDAAAHKDIVSTQDRPREAMPVPAGLDWDLWLGPAPERPFHEVYFPGPKWYRWWDFGSGTMSDLGSHFNDLPFWALNLDVPLTVEGFGPPVHPELAPASFRAVYQYGARGSMPPVTLTWYQGVEKPPQWQDRTIPTWDNGVLFVGDKGMLLVDYRRHVLLPEERFKDFQPPPPSIPKSLGHHAEWINAAKTGAPTTCNFAYASRLTIANHLGSIAYRLGKKLEWDPVALRARNAPEADRLLRRPYRAGWKLGG